MDRHPRRRGGNMLKGKVAIVTGSSRGIGAAIAKRLARDGARVIVNYARRADAAEQVVREIKSSGGEAKAIAADVSGVDGVVRLFDESERAYGQADVLVNN